MHYWKILFVAFSLSALESLLILTGAITPLATYSPTNLVFLLLRLGLVVYAGWALARDYKQAVFYGAGVSLASSITMAAFVFLGRMLNKPVLGLSVGGGEFALVNLALVLLLNIILSSALGGVVAALALLLKRKAVPQPIAREAKNEKRKKR